jgi:cytochrome c553
MPTPFLMTARVRVALVLVLSWSCWVPAAQASDASAGRQKAQACSVCHGSLGLSVTPDAPHLAGQPVIYLAAQLRAYRSGARKHEVMVFIAKPLSDDDINNLAAWFSSIRIDAQAPP